MTRSIKKRKYIDVLKKELNHFESIAKDLLQDPKYREKFIAIKNQEIIGLGDDELDLVEQVQLKFPDQVILVTKVGEVGNPVDIPSVEVIE